MRMFRPTGGARSAAAHMHGGSSHRELMEVKGAETAMAMKATPSSQHASDVPECV
jgi:hypothetical protein